MKHLSEIVALLAAITITSTRVVKSPRTDPEDGNFELLILHNNDMHGRFEETSQTSGICKKDAAKDGKCYGGFARVAHLVKKARRAAASGKGPPVLFLNAGDTFTGSVWFTIFKWQIASEFINALQPDAMCLGNHEFDYEVAGLVPFIENVMSPILAANLNFDREPTLKAQRNLMKSVVFDIENTKVGVIGYLTPDTKYLVKKHDVEYAEEIFAVREEAIKLKRQGIKILIALGHSGFTKDLEIAKKVEDIDLVIGGHTNTFLWNGKTPDIEKPEGPYPTIVKQASGRIVAAVQAYAYTKYLGNLHLIFNSDGELVSFHGNPILLNNSVPKDPDVLSIESKYRDNITMISEVVVGYSSVTLDEKTCRLQECNLGNLITDAMIRYYSVEYNGDGWTDAPIAVVASGNIRASISHSEKPMKLTKGDLLSVLPFDDQLVKIEISGASLLEMLEHSVENYDPILKSGAFLQMSGIHVEYDLMKKPGKRVVKALARCGLCDIPLYLPVNRTYTYNILTVLHLSMGGDGYNVFKGLPSTLLDSNLLQVTTEYVIEQNPVHPAVERRIILNNVDKVICVSPPKLNLMYNYKTILDIVL